MTCMRRVRSMVCVLVAVTLVITSFGPAPAASEADGRYIVIYADGISPILPLALTLLGVQVIHVLSLINALAIIIPLDLVGDVLQLLLDNPDVVGVFDDPVGELDYSVSITEVNRPREEIYPWGLDRINIRYVHDQMVESPGSGMTVAILDTGIDRSHPELNPQQNPRIIDCFNALPGRGSCNDDNGHGTHIAGIIAAGSNRQGVIGVAPVIKLAAIKVLDSNGAGHVSDCINGLQRVYTKGYHLVNMSLGFPEDNVPLKRAVDRVAGSGTIMVASVGNTNPRPSAAGEGSDSEATCDPRPRVRAATARGAIPKRTATARRTSSTPPPTLTSLVWAPSALMIR